MEIDGIKICPICRGFKKVNGVFCKKCNGKGWISIK